MINKINLNDLIQISDTILEKSAENKGVAMILSKECCDNFETKFLKAKIMKGFNTYQELICLMKFPTTYLTTVNYNLREEMKMKKNADLVGNQAMKRIDSQRWMIKFYYCLKNVGLKLTKEEAVYLTSAFQKHQTEEKIADYLKISLSSVKKIKKSCLIKTWIELQSLIEECETHSFFY